LTEQELPGTRKSCVYTLAIRVHALLINVTSYYNHILWKDSNQNRN